MRVLGAGRVAFLALRETIAAELAEGWSMAEVFRRHQDQLGIQIAQFRSYVSRYVAADKVWAARRKRQSAPSIIGAPSPQPPGPAAAPPAVPPPAEAPHRITRSINLKRDDLI
jgi:hypothetical protein